jgi:hypothetical protein
MNTVSNTNLIGYTTSVLGYQAEMTEIPGCNELAYGLNLNAVAKSKFVSTVGTLGQWIIP